MSRQQNNPLSRNLPQLQNLIKRDPGSYEEEFEQQHRYFESTLQVFKLEPTEYNKTLEEIVMFLAQVAKCYPVQLSSFPQVLVDLLREHSTTIDPDMRMSFCRALILLRHRDLLAPVDLLKLFFDLLKCPDKVLRKFLKDHIINDIKNSNQKHKDVKLNSSLQNFMFKTLQDAEKAAAKTSLDVMVELYRNGVWRDAKTVNSISHACFSDVTKLMVTGLKFFLGKDEDEEDAKKDDSDDELPTVKDVTMANKVNKKTRKRERLLENIKKAHRKKKRKDKNENFNFSAIHLIHDPQGFAEKLFKKLDSLREKFEVKLMFLDLVSRLIGTHELFVLNYYQYIARFLNPHQREVVQMLQFSAQAAHELVPADAVEPVIKAIVSNFVTERNAAEVMAVGLNAVRELCRRCPLAMDETLLRDLAGYKTYKDKGVMMAAKSLIALYRTTYPELLHKKDRGRPTEATAERGSKRYGEMVAKDYVPGAEEVGLESGSDEAEETDDDDDDDEEGEWVDVAHSSDEEKEGEKKEDEKEETTKKEFLTLEEKRKKAGDVASSRILSDADFKRIDAALLKKEVQSFRKGSAKARKRKHSETVEDDEGADGDEAVVGGGRKELVDLASIEMVHKKRKHDKDARLETVLEGRKDREKFGSKKSKMNENASTTNKQKAKKKNFMMIKHKLKIKARRSFAQKAKDLKRSLIRSKKFK